MKIEKAIFVNRAPFQKVEFDFLESGVNVLSGINGRGKTTVISHIVDFFTKWQDLVSRILSKERKIRSIVILQTCLILQALLILYFMFVSKMRINVSII